MRFFPWKRKYDEGDEQLLAMYRSSGEKAIVGELYTRYAHLIFGVCLKYFRDKELARDAVLQLFEKMFDVLKRNEPENFKAWILFVARNHCISELRKRNVEDERMENFKHDEKAVVEGEVDEEVLLKKEERLLHLEHAVKELGEEQRKCIELFYFREKSYEEIVEITGYTDKQVKSYLQNGKRNLKLILENKK
ncbi:MAG TPA: sigma-70 family RNA polymerase sigma factor [Bacteroidia bacterium]|jgi:RNA polymerase sigma-70 factor (ECF subfamily)|nr:sigma-70 family RNA polymerase sigma factor [Bacteroidia bacterium]